jgi:hypothetical protein
MASYYYPSEDQKLNIARGLVKGTSIRNIFGYNSSVNSAFKPLWELGSVYTYPTQNLTMDVVSTNTNDTSVTVKIVGLDSDYNELSETLTLNGTSTVTSNNEYFRINDVITIAGNADGNVNITNSSVTYARIRAGDGRNQASIYTVPANTCFYLYRIDGFSATATGSQYVTFRNEVTNSSNVTFRVAETTFINQMNIQRRLPFKYDAKSDIQFQCKSSASTNEVGVFGEGILIKDGLA